MGPPPPLEINPPLLNSACPWATDLQDLKRLYACPHTGAVTTRTSLIHGFPHDDSIHRYALFDTSSHAISATTASPQLSGPADASLNTLGYSPHVLATYLGFIKTIADDPAIPHRPRRKTFIVSVTGSAPDVARCYRLVAEAAAPALPPGGTGTPPLAVELNLSCPNIPGAPPPAYDAAALRIYLAALCAEVARCDADGLARVPFGLKTPPYTHAAQYEALIGALLDSCSLASPSSSSSSSSSSSGKEGRRYCPVSFLTATNTLGSSLVLDATTDRAAPAPALPGRGIGGMAGAPLHGLALGNVATLRRMLDEHRGELGHVRIVGVGGVLDGAGYGRMRSVGAYAVGVGTGLGLKGVEVFDEIRREAKLVSRL